MKISIVVPCYNVAGLLSRCINSILSQTFQDWEMLLVDDGSIDETGHICDKYALHDARIKVIHKKNGGVSSTRNIGIKLSQGDYVTFIDADDYIEPDYLQSLLGTYQSDFVIGGFKSSRGINFIPSSHFYVGDHLSGEDIRSIVEHRYLLYTPWGKLFKRDIIEKYQLCFDPKLRYGEDTIFCYEYLLVCCSIEIIANNGYFYDGEWGGGRKYALTYEEIMYLDNREISILRRINDRFNSCLDLKYRGYHVSMLAGLYEHYTDVDVYYMYCTTHGAMDLRSFHEDRMLSYIFGGLIDLEGYCRDHSLEKCRVYMRKLCRFMTLSTRLLRGYSLKMRLVHWNLRHGLFFLNYIIIQIAYKWKTR